VHFSISAFLVIWSVFYQPAEKPQTFKRTVLRSKSIQISSDKFAELEK
jgi:hypothetical protein